MRRNPSVGSPPSRRVQVCPRSSDLKIPRRLIAAYTVEGPLVVGAALAGGADDAIASLRAYGAPLGEAFQLLDDLRDGDAEPGATPEDALALVEVATQALDRRALDPRAVEALAALAELVGAG